MSNAPEPQAMTLGEAYRQWFQEEPHNRYGSLHYEAFRRGFLAGRESRDDTAELRQQCVCNKCGWSGVATGPHYWHDGCNYSAITALDMELYENRRLRDDTAELVEALEGLLNNPRATMPDPFVAPDVLAAFNESVLASHDAEVAARAALAKWKERVNG